MITVVTEKVIARRVAAMPEEPEPEDVPEGAGEVSEGLTLRPEERKGLRNAGLVLLAYAALVVVAMVPAGSPLRGEGGSIVESPVLTGIAVVLAVAFLIVGAVYGGRWGRYGRAGTSPTRWRRACARWRRSWCCSSAISQFLAYFKWTGVGEVLAIRGAGLLKSAGITGPVAFLGVLLICTVINLLVTSGSAQWALVSPVFVPMFMLLDIPPEVTQAVYRIADSCTNAATPMSAYFVMTLSVVQRYRRSAGIGTLLSLTLPLCLVMLVAWTLLFYAWWALGIPLGPGVPVR
ncbi:aminobenzoyl-glutamate transporter [Streptomyces purpurascens]